LGQTVQKVQAQPHSVTKCTYLAGAGLEKSRFLEKVFRFTAFLGFNWTQNCDPDINEEYFIHDTPFPLPRHL